MSNGKISISLDEVNSPQVDTELHRQDVADRIAEHQEKIRINFGGSNEVISSKSGVFRKAMVYMAVFGFVFSILSWGIGELIEKAQENHPWFIANKVFSDIYKIYPNATPSQINQILETVRENNKEQANNPYLQENFWSQSNTKKNAVIENAKTEVQILNALYYILVAVIISIGLSIAEACVDKNIPLVLKNGLLGAILGAVGGFIVSLFIDWLYHVMGGGLSDSLTAQQILARGFGWGIIGMFVAIAPGIIMKNGKKFWLGIAGGFLGGLLGGWLFDPICISFHSVTLARFVNIVGLGVGAAIATVLLENIAKQGWLKVVAGLIAGKQFILYRNPTVIGSSPKCEIYLFKDPQIISKHAAISNLNGEFIITSLENAPVFVNNIQIKQQRLKTGDQIKIGNTVFLFNTKVLNNRE